jgi:hypothetical protein
MFHDAQKQPDQSENTVINTKNYFINIGFLKVNQISKKIRGEHDAKTVRCKYG